MALWLQAMLKERFDTSSWSGAASNWDSAEAYCRDCLVDLNPSGAKKTKDKCYLPFRKPGSKKVNKNALRAMASGGRGIAKAGIPAAEKAKAARWAARLWPAAFGTKAPPSLVKLTKAQTKETPRVWQLRDMGSSLSFKETDQGLLFIGLFSNKFQDMQAEIIEEAAHKEAAQWVNSHDIRVPITLMHAPKMPRWFWLITINRYRESPKVLEAIYKQVYKDAAIGETLRYVVLNGFAMVVGRVYKEKERIARRLMRMKDLGMSHGFVSTGLTDNIVKKYRPFEVTILPRFKAANLFTVPLFGFVGGKDMNQVDMKFLLEAGLTDEDIKKLDEATEGASGLLAEFLNFKEVDDSEEEDVKTSTKDVETQKEPVEETEAEETPTEEVTEETEETTEAAVTVEVDVDELKDQILAEFDLEGLQTLLKGMGDLIKANAKQIGDIKNDIGTLAGTVEQVKESDDDKIARQLTPTINWANLGFSATQDKEQGEGEPEGEPSPEKVEKLKEGAATGDPEVEGKVQIDRNNPFSMLYGQLLQN